MVTVTACEVTESRQVINPDLELGADAVPLELHATILDCHGQQLRHGVVLLHLSGVLVTVTACEVTESRYHSSHCWVRLWLVRVFA